MKVLAYHGSDKKFDRFDPDVPRNDVLIDRYLGIHFAKDIEIAKKFGKYVAEVELDINNPLDVRPLQRECNLSDQEAIEVIFGRFVLSRHEDIFHEVYAYLPKNVRDSVLEDIRSGRYKPSGCFKDPWEYFVWDRSPMFFNLSEEEKIRIARVFRRELERAGYDAVIYENTAPMEIEGARDLTCYIVWNPSKIYLIRWLEVGYGKPHWK